MPPIRVLQVMPAMDAGGMETFVMNVYRTIDREKVQFDFLYHYDKPCFFDDEIRALGGRIFKLTVRQDNNLPRYLRELRALFAAHPEWRIIHGHYSGFGMFYNPAARRAGIPVRCGHSHNTAYERNFVGRLDHFMSSFFNIGLTDRFACSEKAGQMLFGKHPFTVVPNGIDTARFAARDPQRRALLRGELGVTDQEILFGHVGRFSDQKNHPGLLKIFAAVRTRLPKARLVLLGGGDPAYVEKMQALAAELGLGDSVIFAGVRSNIQSFYDAMDAFLLPSLFEGLPVVLVEAQTAGLPCFVADTVDKGAAFTDRVHFLPLQDEAAWANTIAGASLRRDPDARRKAVEAQTEAQIKIIGAQGEAEALKIHKQAEAEAYRMQATAEAEEMRMKGFTYQQQTARQVGMEAMQNGLGGNGAAGGLGDIAGLGVALGAMGSVVGITRDALNPVADAAAQMGRAVSDAMAPGGWDCPDCGQRDIPSNFCPNCGKKRPGQSTGWDCPDCGQKGVISNFCPNCGKKRPEQNAGWDCPDCGQKGIASNFCPNCGKKREG